MAGQSHLQWDSPVAELPGVGSNRLSALTEIGLLTAGDCLLRVPRRYLDRTQVYSAIDLPKHNGENVTVTGTVESFGEQFLRGRNTRMFRVLMRDETGPFELTFFKGLQYYRNSFVAGDWYAVSGKVDAKRGRPVFVHASIEKLSNPGLLEAFRQSGRIVPVYSSDEHLEQAKLGSRNYSRFISRLLTEIEIPLTIPPDTIERCGLPNTASALKQLHLPETMEETQQARTYLVAEELFYFQMAILLKRAALQSDTAKTLPSVGDRTRALATKFPFELTAGQRQVLNEIYKDLRHPRPMLRLLQGDVGSGKTVVALLTLMMAVEAGWQGALMCPTEILAEQHYLTSVDRFEELGVRVALFVSGLSAARQREIIGGLQTGDIQVVIGTHALIQDRVKFRELGLVIIDEQHRFGVRQRALLADKGQAVHTLVMTATPIPRTLALTAYGDLEVSLLKEKPALRGEITTRATTPTKRPEVYKHVRQHALAGYQSYIVFPLVDESEALDLRAATTEYEALRTGELNGIAIGLLHGKMSLEEKNSVLHRFAKGELMVLVATTVIEVGVDVPKATTIVIEHAERFGLAQLHQLRGRVGRSVYPSTCYLIVYKTDSDIVKERIRAFRHTTDGFELAEVDLTLRGQGEYFGTRQHGLPELQWADVVEHRDWVFRMREEAERQLLAHPVPDDSLMWQQFRRRYEGRWNWGRVA